MRRVNPLIEVRWHGRGGQGVVTSSELLARAVLKEGKYVQHFPEFGPERRGAPVRAFTRIDDKPIDIHYGIYEPDIVVVIDPVLLSTNVEGILSGLKNGGYLVLNTTKVPEDIARIAKEKNLKVYTVNAHKIALEIFNRPLYNTPMLGALVKATGLASLNSVLEALGERFKGEILEKNKIAVKRAYEEVVKYEV